MGAYRVGHTTLLVYIAAVIVLRIDDRASVYRPYIITYSLYGDWRNKYDVDDDDDESIFPAL